MFDLLEPKICDVAKLEEPPGYLISYSKIYKVWIDKLRFPVDLKKLIKERVVDRSILGWWKDDLKWSP
jgi:hypothetical protein